MDVLIVYKQRTTNYNTYLDKGKRKNKNKNKNKMFDCNYNELSIGDTVSYIDRSYTGKTTIRTGIITGFKKYFGKDCAIIGDGLFAGGKAMQQSIRLLKKKKIK